MPKSDMDALVMHLVDKYGVASSGPLESKSNQSISEMLHTPVSRVKKLRYEAALKYGGSIEELARGRLLAALTKATLEPQEEKVCLIIEDLLAKYWLQGQLKSAQQAYDHSFNTEIIRVTASGLFDVLGTLFDEDMISTMRAEYDKMKSIANRAEWAKLFRVLMREFALGAANSAGGVAVSVLKAHLGLI